MIVFRGDAIMKVLIAVTLSAYLFYFMNIYLSHPNNGNFAGFALLSAQLLTLILLVASLICMLLRRSMKLANLGVVMVTAWWLYMLVMTMISLEART
jgi:hypothetical protein